MKNSLARKLLSMLSFVGVVLTLAVLGIVSGAFVFEYTKSAVLGTVALVGIVVAGAYAAAWLFVDVLDLY